ncbi:MAG: hypothetical protein IIC12_05920 [Proteobacteria bacterium]|nr:hypothetical protein [Pseudomonadota bacterium]
MNELQDSTINVSLVPFPDEDYVFQIENAPSFIELIDQGNNTAIINLSPLYGDQNLYESIKIEAVGTSSLTADMQLTVFQEGLGDDRPIVTDTGDSQASLNTLQVSWTFDNPTGIVISYYYSAGTLPYENNIVDWTSVGLSTMTTINGLSLQKGHTYYISVKAQYTDGTWTSAGTTDGMTIVLDAEDRAYLHLYKRMDAYIDKSYEKYRPRLVESYMSPYPINNIGQATITLSYLPFGGTPGIGEFARGPRCGCVHSNLLSRQENRSEGWLHRRNFI